jgi:hypothetical protein
MKTKAANMKCMQNFGSKAQDEVNYDIGTHEMILNINLKVICCEDVKGSEQIKFTTGELLTSCITINCSTEIRTMESVFQAFIPESLLTNLLRAGKLSQYSDWATGWTIGVRFQEGEKTGFFLFTTASRPVRGTIQSPIQWVKRPGREADHSSPSTAEVKNPWSYNSPPPYVFMA